MLAGELAGPRARRRSTGGVDGAFDAAALEEAEAKVGVLCVSEFALELVLSIGEPFRAGDDPAAVFLLPEILASRTRPAVDAVDFKRRVAPSVVGENPASGAGDGCG